MSTPAATPLSSPVTVFYKFVIPAFILFWLFMGAHHAFTANLSTRYKLASVVAIFGAWALFRIGIFRFKKIEVRPHTLIVSNYVKTIEIPFDQIETAQESRYWAPPYVIVKLKSSSAFGDTLAFAPRSRNLLEEGEHPVCARLRNFALDGIYFD